MGFPAENFMTIEYLGLNEVNGPLAILTGVTGAAYDEIAEIHMSTNSGKEEVRTGRVIEIYGDKVIMQVFEGTESLSLKNTRTLLTGHPMEMALSRDMLGRTFNGSGKPLDGLGPVISTLHRDINGQPINPVSRKYPP